MYVLICIESWVGYVHPIRLEVHVIYSMCAEGEIVVMYVDLVDIGEN